MKTKTSDRLKAMREKKALTVKRLGSAIKKVRRHVIQPNRMQVQAKPDNMKVLISIPPRLNRQLDANANRLGISKSALVRRLIVKNRARVGK